MYEGYFLDVRTCELPEYLPNVQAPYFSKTLTVYTSTINAEIFHAGNNFVLKNYEARHLANLCL